MSSLREKERRKEQQDKFQAILSALLKDEDNKYCVDCDAKGPRWASWNLGIFLCIRCAGIHRNLGVHISRVKSVNLDTWTPEQVAMMQEIGNSRARAAYEANLPDGYRRPQTDSALEAFIRAKYEHKKYMAREWVPPQPKVPKEWLEDKTEKKKPKPKQPSAVKLTNVPKSNSSVETSKPQQPVQKSELNIPNPSEAKVNSLADDLLGLDLAPPQTNVQQPPSASTTQSGNNDLLELFGAPQQASQTNVPSSVANSASQASNQTNSAVNGAASEGNLFGEDAEGGEKKTSTKDSIMALFGGSNNQPQMYGVPGADGQCYNVPYYELSNNIMASPYCGFANFDVVHQANGQVNMLMPVQGFGMPQPNSQPVGSPPGQFKPGMDFASLTNQLSAFNETAPIYVCKLNQIYTCKQAEEEMEKIEEGMSRQETKTKNGETVTLVVPNTRNVSGNPVKQVGVSGQTVKESFFNDMHTSRLPNPAPDGGIKATNPFPMNNGLKESFNSNYCHQGGMYIAQNQQGFPSGMPQQGMMGQQNQGMLGQQNQGMMGQQNQGMMGQQQGMMGQHNQGMMGQQQGMMGQQQGMMGQQQGMMGHQGIMGQNQGMMAPQQNMMGAQQGMMGMMGQQHQQPGMMGQQQPSMMGNAMMNGTQQPGMFQGQGQMMMSNTNMYAPQQMQQLQFQQMQQPMGKPTNSWGNPAGQTLSNNLWQ